MVPHQMFLVPRILLHPLIVLQTPKDALTEAVKVRHVCKLRVVELGHELPASRGVVYLDSFLISKRHGAQEPDTGLDVGRV